MVGPAELGNDKADSLANSFRLHGEKVPADEVDWKWEESFAILDGDRLVQGDIRVWAKDVEQKLLLEKFAQRKLQSMWMKKNHRQILRMADEVWNWSIDNGDGNAWIYFIFAISNWLPTFRRKGKRKERSHENEHLRHCPLCLTGEVDDIEHIMRCPALYQDLMSMCVVVKRSLEKFGFSSPSISEGDRIRDNWFNRARREFLEPPSSGPFVVESVVLRRLLDDWIRANGIEKTYGSFAQAVRERLRKSRCECKISHECGLENRLSLPVSLCH